MGSKASYGAGKSIFSVFVVRSYVSFSVEAVYFCKESLYFVLSDLIIQIL